MAARAKRYLGIELGGTRRTAVVSLDLFAAEGKGFVAETHSPVPAFPEETPDDALIRVVNEANPVAIGLDAPLSLPPCIDCKLPCPTVGRCEVPAVRWMREEGRRLNWGRGRLPNPYTQRPVDLLLRGRWLDEASVPYPVDESFGSSRAPLAARMRYLARHLGQGPLVEVNPRLALGCIARWYGISDREVRLARDVEGGVDNRLYILQAMGQAPRVEGAPHLFLYNADVNAFGHDLSAFDAFLCAFMALLGDQKLLEEQDWPAEWGRIAKPRRLPLKASGREAGVW